MVKQTSNITCVFWFKGSALEPEDLGSVLLIYIILQVNMKMAFPGRTWERGKRGKYNLCVTGF